MSDPAPIPTSPEASTRAVRRTMQGNRKTGTRPERLLRSELHRRGLRFRKNYPLRPDEGRIVRPDIVFTRVRVTVFVDGCFWHRCPEHGNSPHANSVYWKPKLDRNAARDRETDRRLTSAGWKIIRVWEHDNIADAADLVQQAISFTSPHFESRSTE